MAKKAPAKAVAKTTSTPFTQQVISQVSDPHVRLAMLTGAALEGGTYGPGSSIGVGDNGHSFGYFQINLPYHPGVTGAKARDPQFAVNYMKGAYTAAAAQIPASLWQSNPEQAAEETAVKAERPAKSYYAARGQSAVDRAYNMAQGALGGPGVPGGSGGVAAPLGGNSPTAPKPKSATQAPKAGKKAGGGSLLNQIEGIPGDIAGAAGDVGNAAQSAASVPETLSKVSDTLFSVSFWIRVAFIVVGAALVFIGTKALLSGNATQNPSSGGEGILVAKKSGPAKKGFGKSIKSGAEDVGEVAA